MAGTMQLDLETSTYNFRKYIYFAQAISLFLVKIISFKEVSVKPS